MTLRRMLLIIAIVVMAVSVMSCRQTSTPDRPNLLPPTWTPTPVPAPEIGEQEITLVSTSLPVSTPESTGENLSEAAPIPEPTVLREVDTESAPKAHDLSSPAAKTSVVPPAVSENGRIDVAGPAAIPTIEPLAPGAGIAPARLLIPKLNLDAPVQSMSWKVIEDAQGVRSEWEVVDYAAGHHINSAFPGEAGNVVLSGHNNIGGAVFQSVCVIGEPGVDFGLGDEMILQDEIGKRFIYQVNGWRRLEEANASIYQRQENAQYLNPTSDAQLTLITCWPPNANTHRVIVTGLLSGIE